MDNIHSVSIRRRSAPWTRPSGVCQHHGQRSTWVTLRSQSAPWRETPEPVSTTQKGHSTATLGGLTDPEVREVTALSDPKSKDSPGFYYVPIAKPHCTRTDTALLLSSPPKPLYKRTLRSWRSTKSLILDGFRAHIHTIWRPIPAPFWAVLPGASHFTSQNQSYVCTKTAYGIMT